MPKKKHLLRVSRLDTIGLVDKGDNPEAHIVFWKRAPEREVGKGLMTFDQSAAVDETRSGIWNLTERLGRVLSEAMEYVAGGEEPEDGIDPVSVINDSLDQFVAAVRAAVPNWAAGQPMQKHQEHDMPKFDVTKLDDAARAEFERLEQLAKDATDAKETAERERDEALAKVKPEPEDVTKGMSPEAKAEFEKAQERAESLEKRLDEVEKKAERDTLAIRFAKGGDLEHVTGESRIDVLLTVKRSVDEGTWAGLEQMLKAASAQIAEGGLFKQNGKDGGDEPPTAWEKIQAKADAMIEKGEAKTRPEAIAAVAHTDPTLYEEYQKERRG